MSGWRDQIEELASWSRYVVTLACGCTLETTDPPAVGDRLPCPGDLHTVMWVRRLDTDTGQPDWEQPALEGCD